MPEQYAWLNGRLRLTPRAFAWRWILALALLASLGVSDQALVQRHLLNQEKDAALINLAGRQRMLAIALQREALSLMAEATTITDALDRLQAIRKDWEAGRLALASPEGTASVPPLSVPCQQINQALDPRRVAMVQALDNIERLAAEDPRSPELSRQVGALLVAGEQFLPLMEGLVGELEDEARSRVQRLRRLELLLTGGQLLLLLAMALFLFVPLGRRLRQDLDLLTTAAQEMRDLSLQDGLTGVANRRHLDERLASEWRRAGRDCQPLSLVMLDVDHFKAYNDAHGHQAGDLALVKVAGAASWAARRAADLTARFGGEEFVLLLPQTSMDGAYSLAEQLRKQVRSLALPHSASPVADVVTVSLGVASYLPSADRLYPEEGVKRLLEAADRSLYKAKQAGRDRVGPPQEVQ